MTDQTAAATILNQIQCMDKMALWDWGCRTYRPEATDNGETLLMKSSGMVRWKGYIAITINRGTDLYDIEFFRMRKPRRSKTEAYNFNAPVKKTDSKVTGVFVEDLCAVIDRQVLKRG